MKKTIVMILSAVAAAAFAQTETKGKPGVVVYNADTTPALQQDMRNRGMEMTLERVKQALDGHLEAAVAGSRKFTVLDRGRNLKDTDIDEIRGADYLIFIKLDSYLDNTEKLAVDGGVMVKRRFQLSGQVKITGGKTTEVLDMSNLQVEKVDILRTDNAVVSRDKDARLDEMMPLFTREFAEKSFERLMGIAFPMKAVDVEDGIITINRGEGFLSVGEKVEIFGKSRVIVDEDTGEETRIKGKSIGFATVTSVEPNYAQAKATGAVTVPAGAEVRKVQAPKK